MKYLFVVQGEGRGHFTQALSLKYLLEKNGHEVIAVMVGRSSNRSLPDFFTQKIGSDIVPFMSPNFLPVPKSKKSFLLLSVIYNLILTPQYIESIWTIYHTILAKKPDVVVNFYELLCGLTYGIFNPKAPMVNVAHQYYFLTSNFVYSGSKKSEFNLLNLYSKFTALNASKILALSFRQENDFNHQKIKIVPPLLRAEVKKMKMENGDYIHGYILNSGFVNELINWSKENNRQKLHFFWDKKGVPAELALTDQLTMHTLDDSLFLQYMAGSKAFATTGGFESVCEAMYLQKPVLMIPAHIEQECNVSDAMRSGAGITAEHFKIDNLINFIPHYEGKSEVFRNWVSLAEQSYLNQLTDVAGEIDVTSVSLYNLLSKFIKYPE